MSQEKGVVIVKNKEKADHKTPSTGAHGLSLAQPSVVFLCGGTGASKTTTVLSLMVHGFELQPWDEIFLMSPSLESAMDKSTGEYRLCNVTALKTFPPIEFWKAKKGQKNLLVIDDVDLTHLSTRGSPSQRELCDRTMGYVSTHMNTTCYVLSQTWVGAPPFVRKLCTHFILYPNRLDRASIPHIAKGVMLHKDTLAQLFGACVEPYDFLLITLKPDGRAMVRINGHRAVHNIMG